MDALFQLHTPPEVQRIFAGRRQGCADFHTGSSRKRFPEIRALRCATLRRFERTGEVSSEHHVCGFGYALGRMEDFDSVLRPSPGGNACGIGSSGCERAGMKKGRNAMKKLVVKLHLFSRLSRLSSGNWPNRIGARYFGIRSGIFGDRDSFAPFSLQTGGVQPGLIEHVDRPFWASSRIIRRFTAGWMGPAADGPDVPPAWDRSGHPFAAGSAVVTWDAGRWGCTNLSSCDGDIERDDRLIDLAEIGTNAQEVFSGEADEVCPLLIFEPADRLRAQVAESADRRKWKQNCQRRGRPSAGIGTLDRQVLGQGRKPGCGAGGICVFDDGPVRLESTCPPPGCFVPVKAAGSISAYGRFDREPGNRRLHVHTFANLVHANFRIPSTDYADLLKVTSILTRNHADVAVASSGR